MSNLLEVRKLKTVFHGDMGKTVSVDGISFIVKHGETLCLVGESGCGKSVTALSIMRLLSRGGEIEEGSVHFDGQDLLKLTEKELDNIRGNQLTMIFQDALSSLNPLFTVGNQLMESIRTHLKQSRKEARGRAIELLSQVGLADPEKMMRKYPFTLSGGMRQRVMIAMALSCNPKLLIADEPTTALDVTIQAQIMNLMKSAKEAFSMSVILITHDIGLVAEMADRVLVMYAGQIIEEALVRDLFRSPAHPYTQALLSTVPSILDDADRKLTAIPGLVPERYQDILGCRFAERCVYAKESCQQPQDMMQFGEQHLVRCHLAKEISDVVEKKEA